MNMSRYDLLILATLPAVLLTVLAGCKEFVRSSGGVERHPARDSTNHLPPFGSDLPGSFRINSFLPSHDENEES